MSEGVTDSERYLTRLCRQSFLKLWSWSNLHKDQGGKEICDLLVVFDKHLLVFSDKDCEFPDTGDLKVDWARWYRRAVLGSAKQVWGAERWLLNHPDRIFLDAKCSEPFPLEVPTKDEAIVHRIVVAHGARVRCIQHFEGGSGSLITRSHHHQGDDHLDPERASWAPFTIGQIDEAKGFVHVLDDVSLDVVLKELDTIQDFVWYLEKRKELLTGSRPILIPGEEEALAHYMLHMETEDRHGFRKPPGNDPLTFEQGNWDHYQSHPTRIAKEFADEVSYLWDKIIDKVATHAAEGTHTFSTSSKLSDTERGLRLMAAEPRVRRRMLGKSLLNAIEKGRHGDEFLRGVEPSTEGDPLYIFLTLDPKLPIFESIEDYRQKRRELLYCRCMIKKLDFPHVPYIVGIATEPLNDGPTATEDLCVLDLSLWTDDDEKQAIALKEQIPKPYSSKRVASRETEFPLRRQTQMKKGRNRNQPCLCGSGKKWKKCCGRSA